MSSLSVRYGPWMIGFWVLLTACFVPFAIQLPKVLGNHGLTTDGSYAQVQKLLSRELQVPDEPTFVLFHNSNGLSEQAFFSALTRTLERISRISGTVVVSSPLERREMIHGEYAYAEILILPGSVEDKRQAMERVRGELIANREVKATLAGKPVVQEDVNRLSRQDLKKAETIGLPIAFMVLVFSLGGLLPALIPLAAGAMAVVISMGILYGIGAYSGMTLSVFVYNVIPMVGMAVCIDFALLIVSRFREERRIRPTGEALRLTLATSGRAVAVSTGCVVLALIGTLYIRMPIFNSVALGALVVLLVSLLINLTFVPAILHALRHKLFVDKEGGRHPTSVKIWNAFVGAVLKRPAASAALAVLILLACMSPVRSMQVGVPGPESLPDNREARIASETIAKYFQRSSSSLAWIAVKAEAESRATVDKILRDLRRDSRVVQAQLVKSESRRSHFIAARLNGVADSQEAMEWVRERERQYAEENTLVGGEPKYHQEVHDEVFGRIRYVLLFVVLSNLVVLVLAFRSLLIPLKAIAMNLAGIGAAFGLLAWLFQEGRFGLEATDVAIMIPVFLFGLTFGISMDYGIFLLSRIYECYRETGDNERAIREGLASSGKIITAAAAIMIAVTAPFALAGVSGVKQLGIGIAAALLLDATIIRLVLVPALMKCFGKWNWWLPFARN